MGVCGSGKGGPAHGARLVACVIGAERGRAARGSPGRP